MARVAVVGAGIAGLTAALRLSQNGHEVVVFESASKFGGVLQSPREDGFLCESAANGFLPSAAGAGVLADELGVATEPASAAAKSRWIYSRGALRKLPRSPLDVLGTDVLSMSAKLSLLAEPLRAAPPAGDVSIGEFFRQRLGDEVVERLITPFVTGIYAGDVERLSLRAAFPRLAAVVADKGLVRGLLSKLVSGGKRGGTGGPMRAPQGGMAALPAALADALPEGCVRYERAVVSLARDSDKVRIDTVTGPDTFDAAVVAAPAHAAAALLADSDAELAAVLREIRFLPVAAVHLGYRRDQVGHALDGFGFLVAPGEDVRVLGMVFESAIWPNRAPDDHVLVRCMLGGHRDPDLALAPPAHIVRVARDDAERVLSIEGEPVHTRCVSWPRGIAQYEIGHTERVAKAERRAAEQRVVLAGSSYRGVSVNRCIEDATEVVARVAKVLAALILCCSLSAVSACSSTSKTSSPPTGDDGGDASVKAAATTSDAAAVPTGVVEVTVKWLDPPSDLVTSPGVTKCNTARPAKLRNHSSGGVVGAIVAFDDAPARAGSDVVEVAVEDCVGSPVAVAVSSLSTRIAVTNRDQRPHLLSMRRADVVVGEFPLMVVGQRLEHKFEAAGWHRLSGKTATNVDVLVTDGTATGMTDGFGKVRFDAVPVGRRTLKVFTPRLGDGDTAAKTVGVEVRAGEISTVDIDLSR